MTEYLNLEQIQQVIMQYVVNPKSELAILINGEWGIGKTYYIDNIIIPHIKNNTDPKQKKNVIKVSLYGLKNYKELYNRIYLKMIWNYMPESAKGNIIEKIAQTIKKTYDLLSEKDVEADIPSGSISFGVNLPAINDMVELANVWTNLEDYVLIFDDLERCEMLPQEILGIINDFITEKKCKCIIISNENEINKIRYCKDTELKYMVALNNNLKIKNSENSYNEDSKTQNKVKFDVDDLKKRVDALFSENNEYNIVKEKVIGRTIYFMPDLYEIVEDIVRVEDYKESGKKYIVSSKNEIIELMKLTKHFNIRTLIYAFNEFQRIIIKIEECDVEKDEVYEKSIKKVLLYIVYAAIKNKTNNKQVNRKKEYEAIFIGAEVRNLMAFRFVDKIISYGVVDGDDVKSTFKQFVDFERNSIENHSDPLSILMDYYDYEDDEIIAAINGLKNKLEKKEYKISWYSKIVANLIEIKNMGFDKKYLEEVINIMIKNIEEMKSNDVVSDDLNVFGVIIENNDRKTEYVEIMARLGAKLKEKNKDKNMLEIEKILNSGDGWGEKLGDYFLERQNETLKSGSFTKNFDINQLAKLIKDSKARDIADFSRTINSVYSFGNIKEIYAEDYENLSFLKSEIDKVLHEVLYDNKGLTKIGHTKLYNLRFLEADLKDVLKRLK